MNDIVVGKAVTIAPGVRRVTANNPGVMTGPGTNTYLLGEERVTVIDPGPPLAEHADAIMQAIVDGGGELAQILTTHTHPDHSPCTRLLLERQAAPVMGALVDPDGRQDEDFAPDAEPVHDALYTPGESRLRAIHTPGHVANHYCWLDEATNMLFTGDHIMQGSTVVIVPPAGDMKAYIDSLKLLRDYPVRSLAPGHGTVIVEPAAEVEHLIKHRLGREAKIIAACQQLPEATVEQLVPIAYADVDPSLHVIAAFSLLAHMIKLQQEGRAEQRGEVWHWLGE